MAVKVLKIRFTKLETLFEGTHVCTLPAAVNSHFIKHKSA